MAEAREYVFEIQLNLEHNAPTYRAMKNHGNTHETLQRNEEPARGSNRGFGLVMASVFVLFGIWPLLFGDGDIRGWALIVAVLLLVVAMVAANVLGPFNTAWLKFGLLLSRVVNPIVLGAMFYLVITPFGLVARLFGKDFLRGQPLRVGLLTRLCREEDPNSPEL